MSDCARDRWVELQDHWNKNRRQVMPATARKALTKAGEKVGGRAVTVGHKVADRTPQMVKEAGDYFAEAALEPTIKATLSLLEFTTRLVSEFTDPDKVLQYYREQGAQGRDPRGSSCSRLEESPGEWWGSSGGQAPGS
jgi:hypothetical protein